MSRGRVTISLLAACAVLCLYSRGGLSLLPTVLLSLAAHELSHVLALRAAGLRVTGLRLEPRGLCIRYAGDATAAGTVACALAGPLGGALYAMAASRSALPWLRDSAALSLLLTAFNLLPILPLDGGRVFSALCEIGMEEERADRLYRVLSRVLLALLLVGGVGFAAWKKATAPLAAAIWLLLAQNEEEGLAKNQEII